MLSHNNFLSTLGHKEIVILILTFIVNSIINLIGKSRYKYERKEYQSQYFENI